jgi:hypothetical protein
MILIGAGAFVLGMALHNEARAPSPEIDRRAEAPFNGDTATRLVADPYPTTGGKIAVTASLRDDPLGQLFARRQIDEAQYRPGRMVEEWLELSEIGSVQAIDPAKEAVDGRGQYVEAITDKRRTVSLLAAPRVDADRINNRREAERLRANAQRCLERLKDLL